MTRVYEGAFRMIDHSSEVGLECETCLFYLIRKPDWSLSVHLHGGEPDLWKWGPNPTLSNASVSVELCVSLSVGVELQLPSSVTALLGS